MDCDALGAAWADAGEALELRDQLADLDGVFDTSHRNGGSGFQEEDRASCG